MLNPEVGPETVSRAAFVAVAAASAGREPAIRPKGLLTFLVNRVSENHRSGASWNAFHPIVSFPWKRRSKKAFRVRLEETRGSSIGFKVYIGSQPGWLAS